MSKFAHVFILLLAINTTAAFSKDKKQSKAKKQKWCCMVKDKVASFETKKKKKRNICLKSAAEPSSPKSTYVKKCSKLSGVWKVQSKQKKG